MATFTFQQRGFGPQPSVMAEYLTGFMSGNATVGTNKTRWVLPFAGRIVAVYAHATGNGSGTGSTTIDIKKNGTSIFSTQPSIASADDGYFTGGAITTAGMRVSPGDQLALDVTAIPATSGHPNVSVTVVVERR